MLVRDVMESDGVEEERPALRAGLGVSRGLGNEGGKGVGRDAGGGVDRTVGGR